MLLTLADLEELIKKSPEISDFNFTNLTPEELLPYLYEKLNKKLLPKNLNKDFLNYLNLNLKRKNKKILLGYLRYFILISKLNSTENTGFIQGIKQINGFNKFQKESTTRIKKLKKELSDKYPEFNELINLKFNNFINELENEFNSFSPLVEQVNNIKLDGKRALNHYKSKKGRPNNALFESFLILVDEFAEELYPKDRFPKIINPFFTYIANTFPDILDITDINSTEKLRQKIKRLKTAKKIKGGK